MDNVPLLLKLSEGYLYQCQQALHDLLLPSSIASRSAFALTSLSHMALVAPRTCIIISHFRTCLDCFSPFPHVLSHHAWQGWLHLILNTISLQRPSLTTLTKRIPLILYRTIQHCIFPLITYYIL